MKTGLCFMMLGVTEFILGMTFGRLLKIKDKYFILSSASNIAILNIVILGVAYYLKSYPLCFIAAFSTGLYESLITNCINLLISQDFDKSKEVINFSIFRLTQSIGVMISILLVIILKD